MWLDARVRGQESLFVCSSCLPVKIEPEKEKETGSLVAKRFRKESNSQIVDFVDPAASHVSNLPTPS